MNEAEVRQESDENRYIGYEIMKSFALIDFGVAILGFILHLYWLSIVMSMVAIDCIVMGLGLFIMLLSVLVFRAAYFNE